MTANPSPITQSKTKRARKHAHDIAAAIGSGEPRRAHDTASPGIWDPRCWVAWETEHGAVVVYDDDPSCQVSTGNHPGRFASPVAEPAPCSAEVRADG